MERYHVGVVNVKCVVSFVHGPIFPGRGRFRRHAAPSDNVIFNNWPTTILVANDVKMNEPSLQDLALLNPFIRVDEANRVIYHPNAPGDRVALVCWSCHISRFKHHRGTWLTTRCLEEVLDTRQRMLVSRGRVFFPLKSAERVHFS